MANYSYQASSYSSGGGAGGADAAFQQADSNRDGRVDIGEFRNFLGKPLRLSESSRASRVSLQDKTSAVVQLAARHRSNRARMVPEPVSALVQAATKHRHSNHRLVEASAVLLVVTTHRSLLALVLPAVRAATNLPRTRATLAATALTLASLLVERLASVVQAATNRPRQARKFSNTLRMLKVSSKTPTHKSSVARLPVVCKRTHRTFAFASCNHLRFHPQA